MQQRPSQSEAVVLAEAINQQLGLFVGDGLPNGLQGPLLVKGLVSLL
ncbi:hypothetical protein [Streptomyces tunisiensis]